jgi:hypothetical protein
MTNNETPIYPHFVTDNMIAPVARPIEKLWDNFIQNLDDTLFEVYSKQGDSESDENYNERIQAESDALMLAAFRQLGITRNASE